MMKNLYLIDSSIYIFRFYFSNRPSRLSDSGREVSTVLSFTRWLVSFLEKEQPGHLACFFDESLGTCFRNEIDAGYKSNRTPPDEALAYELLSCKKVSELLGLKTFASDYYEADDLIGAAAMQGYASGFEPIVITRDKDLGQLLRPDTGYFWDYGYDDAIAYDSFTREFGIKPNHIADYLAIAGDSSDAIAGVKGVGKKTVATLFQHFDGWADLKVNLDKVPSLAIRGASGIAEKLSRSVDLIEHNLKLTCLAYSALNDGALNDSTLNDSADGTLTESDSHFNRLPVEHTDLMTLLDEFNAPKSLITKVEKLSL